MSSAARSSLAGVAARHAGDRLQFQHGRLRQLGFLEIVAAAFAVDDQKVALPLKDEKWIVPDIARIVDALSVGGAKARIVSMEGAGLVSATTISQSRSCNGQKAWLPSG
jgi:hypothetical protein